MDTQKIHPAQVEGQAETPAFRPRATILLVDGEDYIRELLSAILTIEGYKVLDAGSPAEALGLAVNEGPVDLLLSDISFSGGASGRYLHLELRKMLPELRALFTTGYPDAALTRFGIRAEDIIFKPFTPKQLMARIESVLARRAA